MWRGCRELVLTLMLGIATSVCLSVTSSASMLRGGDLATVQKVVRNLIHSVAVFGKDTRKPLPKKYKNLNSYVGRLQNRSGRPYKLCTAFCVAPEVIATVAHCLLQPTKSGRRPRLSNFTFKIGKGRSATQSRISAHKQEANHWNIIAGATYSRRGFRYDSSYDWALASFGQAIILSQFALAAPFFMSE